MSFWPAHREEGVEGAISTLTNESTLATSRGAGLLRPALSLWFPLFAFASTRLVDAAFFIAASRHQMPLAAKDLPGYFVHTPYPADPGYLAVTTNWDGQWYEFIASEGYVRPGSGSADPRDEAWAWAFPPGFPMLVRLFMAVSHLPFPLASTVVNLLLGALAAVLLFRLVEKAGGRFVAASGVALWSCFVSAPLFQAAYSESLAACLLIGSLLSLRSRRYWLTALLVVGLSLTRIITPPLVVVVVAHAAWRWRSGDRPTRSEWAGLGATGLLSATGAFHWSWIATWLAGGDIAFARTQVLTQHRFEWFTKTFEAAGWGGPAFTTLLVSMVVLFAISPRSSAWGLENRVWMGAYVTYLALVTQMHSGILRYLLLAPTLGLMIAGGLDERYTNGRAARIGLSSLVGMICLVGLALQYWWVSRSFIVSNAVTLVP